MNHWKKYKICRDIFLGVFVEELIKVKNVYICIRKAGNANEKHKSRIGVRDYKSTKM